MYRICISEQKELSFRKAASYITSPVLANPFFWFGRSFQYHYRKFTGNLIRVVLGMVVYYNYLIVSVVRPEQGT
jgi:hypothetical protein